MFNNLFFLSRVVYQIKSKNILKPGRPQMTIWRMCIACWIPKATEKTPEYVILFFSDYFDFPLSESFDHPFTLIFVLTFRNLASHI